MPALIDPPPANPPARPLRADARRNYERLLSAAREAVAEHGVEASLDDIAKRAGVGSGTLYRHFPNRLALLEAVFRDQIQLLYDRAQALVADSREPVDALGEWLRALLDYLIDYRGLAMTLKNMFEEESELMTVCHGQLRWSAATLLSRAQEAGAVREDITSSDLLRLLSNIGMASERNPDGIARSERLLSLILDGLRAV